MIGRPEVEPALRQPADDAGLGRQRHEIEQLLLGGHGRHALRHADAEIDDAAERQLEGAAPGDDLALVERQRRDAVHRHAHLAGEGRVVGRGIGLAVVLRRCHDHAVDERARDLHIARVQGAGGGDALHLHDHQALGVLGRHGDREVVEGQRLPLHCDVALRIGRRAAQDRDLDRERLVEHPRFASDRQQLDEVLRRPGVELAPALTRVDEGPQADLRDQARLAPGDLAEELRDAAERQVVALDDAVGGHAGESSARGRNARR